MFTESRAQDAVAIILGAIAALSPLWVAHSNRAMWTLIVLGVLIALTGLAQLAGMAGAPAAYLMGVLGVLLFLSPWVMGFRSFGGAAWTAWIIGPLTVVAALAALPEMSHRMGSATHRPATHH